MIRKRHNPRIRTGKKQRIKTKLKVGDKVIVITGKDKGKEGEIIRIDRVKQRVWVSGVNIVLRHRKPRAANEQGQIERKEAPIHISNVMLKDPDTGLPTKIGYKFTEEGEKVRYAKRSGKTLK